MIMKSHLAIAPVAALLVAACTDPNLDACGNANRDVNLGNLVGNTVSGSFNQCIDDLQQELNSLRLEGRQLQIEEARLRGISTGLSGEERAAAERLANLNATQAALVARIAQSGSAAEDSSLNRVLVEERNLRSALAQEGNGIDAAAAEDLARRQRALDQLTLDLL